MLGVIPCPVPSYLAVDMPKKITVKGLNSYPKRNAKGEVVKDKKGKPILCWKYRFTDKDGVRCVIYLGEGVPEATARYYADSLNHLVLHSKRPGDVLRPVAQTFIDGIDYAFRKKLIDAGLIVETKQDLYEQATTIGLLTDAYLEYHKNDTYNTYKGLKLAVDKFVAFFGKDRKFIDITPTDVRHYQDALYKDFAEAYASRLCGRTQEICRFGIREKMLDRELFERTFDTLKLGKMYNEDRKVEVTLEMYDKIVSACVNTELRFAFFLARFLAFRCPSECNSWKWSYLDFNSRRVKVWDVKRKETRTLPMFEFLYPFFAELLYYHQCKRFLADIKIRNLPLVWKSTDMIALLREKGAIYIDDMVRRFDKGEDFIFSEAFRNRKSRGKQIPQLLKKAKVRLPKPFVNCRGTREGEWVRGYDIYSACKWTGNSVKVAAKHYLSVSKETWDKALSETSETADIETMRNLLKRYTVKGLHDLIDKAVLPEN